MRKNETPVAMARRMGRMVPAPGQACDLHDGREGPRRTEGLHDVAGSLAWSPVLVHLSSPALGRLLVLPRAAEDGVHVYRVRDGALEGPTLITLSPGELIERPLSFSPRLWTSR